MGEIFAGSKVVIIWLGEAESRGGSLCTSPMYSEEDKAGSDESDITMDNIIALTHQLKESNSEVPFDSLPLSNFHRLRSGDPLALYGRSICQALVHSSLGYARGCSRPIS